MLGTATLIHMLQETRRQPVAAQAPGARESAVETLKRILEADVQYCNPFQLEKWVPCSGSTIVVLECLPS